MSNLRLGLGLDLGLRDGAFVAVVVDGDEVTATQVVSSWKKAGRHAAALTLTEQILRLQDVLFQPLELFEFPNEIKKSQPRVGIDWNQHEVFWGSRLPAVTKAFLAGYIYRGLLSKLYLPLLIPPSTVRGLLGLQQSAKKVEVWNAFQRYLVASTREMFSGSTEHVKDAIVLAWAACRTETGVEVKESIGD